MTNPNLQTPESDPAAAGPKIDTSKMSEGKRAALEMTEAAREVLHERDSFAGQLFLGRLPWHMIYPFPQQSAEQRARGEAFLDEVAAFLKAHVDPDEIDRAGEIPQPVIDGLAKLGAFGVKIKPEYGGLGLMQIDYTRLAVLLGSYCGSTAALISVHQSVGVPQPLILFGTEAQKRKFLPRVAAGEISAFALTEANAGSDPAQMETFAVPTPDGSEYVINGEKLWCTNGTLAKVIVVTAKTTTPDGKTKEGITAFLVEMDMPGITITHKCSFMGLKALSNGVLRFENVRVPRENIILGEGKGLKVALTTLNTGRLSVAGACVGASKRCLEFARRWANEREQWGGPIGQHAAIAEKIARMAAQLFAMESTLLLTASLADMSGRDVRVESAMCKLFCAENNWEIINETMQIRGGRGYETAASLKARGEKPVPVERFMRDYRIHMIFEGSSEIMRLLIAREALDPHFKLAGDAINSQAPMGRRWRSLFRSALHYAGWYPRLWSPLNEPLPPDLSPFLAQHVAAAERRSKKLARQLFHAMVRHGAGLEREQVLLFRFVNIGTELFAIAAVCSRAQALMATGAEAEDVLALADFFCRESLQRIDRLFRGISRNNDAQGYGVAQKCLVGAYPWLADDMVPYEC